MGILQHFQLKGLPKTWYWHSGNDIDNEGVPCLSLPPISGPEQVAPFICPYLICFCGFVHGVRVCIAIAEQVTSHLSLVTSSPALFSGMTIIKAIKSATQMVEKARTV